MSDCGGFSITEILNDPKSPDSIVNDSTDIDQPSPRTSASSPLSASQLSPHPSPETPQAGALPNLNPFFMHQMAALCAAASQKQGNLGAIMMAAQQQQAQARIGGAGPSQMGMPAEWCAAYANMQRQMSFGSGQGWDPRQVAWMQNMNTKISHKRKGGQIRFTNEQTDSLETTFDKNKYLTNPQRRQLAKKLQLSERQVKTWFQNRRAKWRRVRKDGDEEEDLAHSIHSNNPFNQRLQSMPSLSSPNSPNPSTQFIKNFPHSGSANVLNLSEIAGSGSLSALGNANFIDLFKSK
ncbi:unnamed protein product [Bursaphelenchus xylophilus]|uniref:(pine wood nematode) hypothetical protein n=1 Tax=Bursaphelenchus xylophilus TaxID=6326 RepID=A0A1I7S006_BURXY|nr:unnamed protein product [Bursaphelenchus xylophilus]CAG9109106.1 unnamed protein product [Bursaphelenchus xylophilus]